MSKKTPNDNPTVTSHGNSAKPQLTTPHKNSSGNKKKKISVEDQQRYSKLATQLSHLINPICAGIFKKYKEFQTNRLLMYPGAELQLVYQCCYPHIGKIPLEEAAQHFKREVLASEKLKGHYSQLHVVWTVLPNYVQIIITIVNDDLYEKLYKKQA